MMKLSRVKIRAKVKGNSGARSQGVSGVGIDQRIMSIPLNKVVKQGKGS